MCSANNPRSLLEVRDGERAENIGAEVDTLIAFVGVAALIIFATLIWVLL
jgi:hypothetical protein